MILWGVTENYLVDGHHERVNIALFRGIAVWEVELCGIQQFRSCVTDNPQPGRYRATRFHDGRITDHTRDPEIAKACNTILTDQDVPLDRTDVGTCLKPRTRSALTGLISLCTILSECRCSRPLAACASY